MRRYLEGDEELFLYTRYANPTVRELEEALAALEDAEAALALSSGHGGDDDGGRSRSCAPATRSWRAPRSTAGRCGSSPSLLPRFGVAARFVAASRISRASTAWRASGAAC